MKSDCVVVGGGAAGLWAAGTLAERGLKALVLEKSNKAGVKILMSGGTRCNITHDCSARAIAEAFGPNGRFLLSPLSRLPPEEVRKRFAELGVESKVEETGKVFPLSDRALDVRDALVERLRRAGADLRTGVGVQAIERLADGNGFRVIAPGLDIQTAKLLITTGGKSYPGCGTTGDGYTWLRKLGHSITDLRPALAPILSPASWVHELSGITLDDIVATAAPEGRSSAGKQAVLFRSRTGFLWTHFGFSGPAAMNVSKHFENNNHSGPASLLLDLLPDQTVAECQAWLDQRSKGSAGHQSITTLLADRLPKRLVATLLNQASVVAETPMAELSKKHRLAIVDRLKAWRLPVSGTRGYPKAEVTAGGVELKEINSQTMQSRLVPGLYLAGEILDLDGPIGGFNFQSAWSTGHTAGLSI
jgi:predicted Rossmann fold flavoprotein